jgi:hypothetical protein
MGIALCIVNDGGGDSDNSYRLHRTRNSYVTRKVSPIHGRIMALISIVWKIHSLQETGDYRLMEIFT